MAATLILLSAGPQAQEAAQRLNHQTQQDVLRFLQDYQPVVVPANKDVRSDVGPETDLQALGAALANKQLVFVAEQHDRYDHHLNQLALLRLMHRQNPQLAIGVEWFQQPFQSVLDNYLSGQLSETDMLRQSAYYERWRYDFRLLRPILEYAREHKLPVIALNAPTEITRKVSAGGLEALSAAEREQIPQTIHPPQKNYRRYLKTIFDEHMGGQGDFERFALIQRIWDETMAANIVQQLHAEPQRRMIVFAGSGHLGADAIPGDVARALPDMERVTVHSAGREVIDDAINDALNEKMHPAAFDYFIVNSELSLPPTGKLGVWLEDHPNGGGSDNSDSDTDNSAPYVAIRQLTKGSAAGEAGMQAGDRFISINGQLVASTAELLLLLAHTRRGQNIEVEFSRIATDAKEREATILQKTIQLK